MEKEARKHGERIKINSDLQLHQWLTIQFKYKQFMEKEAKLILTDTVINGWLSNLKTNNSWRKNKN
jgi:hypothetical protein